MWSSLLHMVSLLSSALHDKSFPFCMFLVFLSSIRWPWLDGFLFSWKCVVLMNSYVHCYYEFIVEFEVWFSDNSIMATFARDSFGYLRLFLCFYIEFRYLFFYFGENQKF